MKRIAGMAGIAALMFFSLATVASAHTVRHDSEVTFHLKRSGPAADSFAGKVVSRRARCERNRTIRVFRRVSEARELVGKSTTNVDGTYEVVLSGDAPAGTYYAVATRKVLRKNAKHLHVCKRAVSRDRRVPGQPGR